jgi:hypothetical protein
LARGSASPLGPAAQSDNYGFRVICIPEPGTLALISIAAGGFIGFGRRFARP